MIEVVGRYNPKLKPPSYYELRVPLLKELDYTWFIEGSQGCMEKAYLV